jgi:aminopeptidase-like protein
MTVMHESVAAAETDRPGREMHAFMAELFPICRSITGEGIRETLRRVAERIPLTIHEVPTGTRVLDWTVPREWNIRDAFIRNGRGDKVVDFKQSNLHVVNYSVPFSGRLSLADLRARLFTLPDHPDWIPYRTSYYKEDWGFCLSHRQLESLADEEYEVVIDSSLQDGHLTYGECYLPGEVSDEVLLSCHACHPSLCNDNLSGVAVAVYLASQLAVRRRRYSYRFLFIPGTIGSITWLARNEEVVGRIRHGLVIALVGGPGQFTYKKSRQGSAEIDRAVIQVLQQSGLPHRVVDFSPYGYDERQFCSPGFNLPVGSLTRTPHGEFPEYHTSADNLQFVTPGSLSGALAVYQEIVSLLDDNRRYMNKFPKGEPQLGKRGVYPSIGGGSPDEDRLAMLWVLNLSDERHTLLDIAARSQLSFRTISHAAQVLSAHGLLAECS